MPWGRNTVAPFPLQLLCVKMDAGYAGVLAVVLRVLHSSCSVFSMCNFFVNIEFSLPWTLWWLCPLSESVTVFLSFLNFFAPHYYRRFPTRCKGRQSLCDLERYKNYVV